MYKRVIIVFFVAAAFLVGMYYGEYRQASSLAEGDSIRTEDLMAVTAGNEFAEGIFARRVNACKRTVNALRQANIMLAYDSVSVSKQDSAQCYLLLEISSDIDCQAQLDARLQVGSHSYEITDADMRQIKKGRHQYKYSLAYLDAFLIDRGVKNNEPVTVTNGISALQIEGAYIGIDWHSPLLVKMLNGTLTEDDKAAIIKSEIDNAYNPS